MKKEAIIVFFAVLASVVFAGNLSCSVKTSCESTETDVLHMSNLTNAHAELPSLSNYTYKVCCNDTTGLNTIGTTGGTTFLRLSNQSNAHVEKENLSNYPFLANISASINSIGCHYNFSACPTNFTCLSTISTNITGGDTNLHIAACAINTSFPYATNICCEVEDLSILAIELTENHTTFDFGNKSSKQNLTSCIIMSNISSGLNNCRNATSHADQYLEVNNTGNTPAKVDVYADKTPQEFLGTSSLLANLSYIGRVTGGGCTDNLTSTLTALLKGSGNATEWCGNLTIAKADGFDLRIDLPAVTPPGQKNVSITFEATDP